MFFFNGKYEGGMVHGKCPHVIVFANEEPDYNKMTDNRFIVRNIRGGETPADASALPGTRSVLTP
jgi:hypothetical protein